MYVEPKYSNEATNRYIEGQVVLHAVIDADGGVKQLTVVSGPPELTQAALDAVRQWHYKKTLLNGQAVEVDTTIAVDFPPRKAPQTVDDLPGMPPATERAAVHEKEAEALAAVDPETVADIRRLMELNGAKNVAAQVFNSFSGPMKDMLIERLPQIENRQQIVDRFVQLMEDRVSSDDLVDLVIPIYAKHFTHDEVKSMIVFFDSPAGRHFVQEAPAYLRDVQQAASEHWTKIVLPDLLEEMRKEFPAKRKPQ